MKSRIVAIVAGVLVLAGAAARAENPFIGRWALTIPGGAAGWIGVEEKDGALQSTILWGGGSVVPVTATSMDGDKLVLRRDFHNKRMHADGTSDEVTWVETITATLDGDAMKLVTSKKENGQGEELGRVEFTGKRIPPVPPAPDLSQVKFGDPVELFNGKDLTGWRLLEKNLENGWRVDNGVLMNRVSKGKRYGNLRTDREFEDFNLKLEVRTLPDSNSGVYLRGIYEVQVVESYGKPVDKHNMGALYSRITPTVAAEKPVGEWQTMDITLVDRHLTVILNGQNIIDNQPILGCTGGAMTSDEFKPGPIYLQGDHSDIDYRNIVLRPVIK